VDGDAGDVDVEQRALLSLAMAAQPNADAIAEAFASSFDFHAMEPGESLLQLAALRERQTTVLPMIIRPLSRLAIGRPDLLEELQPHVRALHVAVAREVGIPEAEVDDVADRLHEELIQLSVDAPPLVAMELPKDEMRRDGDDDDLHQDLTKDELSTLPAKEKLADQKFKKLDVMPTRLRIKPLASEPVVVRQATLAYTNAAPPPPSAPPPPGPIEEYQATTAQVLGVDVDDVSSPPCDDRTRVEGSANGYIVEIEWWTTTPIHKFRPWLKPANWAKCNRKVFFKSMKKVAYQTGPQSSWTGDYVETVEIVPGHPIKTGLSFGHEELRAGNSNSGQVIAMWTTYDLTDVDDAANELLLDHGSLVAQRTEVNNQPMTYIKLSKSYEFKDPAYRLWPTLACDTFFGEISMLMASNCGNGFT
jgi:hypothetical protein